MENNGSGRGAGVNVNRVDVWRAASCVALRRETLHRGTGRDEG